MKAVGLFHPGQAVANEVKEMIFFPANFCLKDGMFLDTWNRREPTISNTFPMKVLGGQGLVTNHVRLQLDKR